MTVEYYEEKDAFGNVIAAEYQIVMPPSYVNIQNYDKADYEPLECDKCKQKICMVEDRDDVRYNRHICFDCWRKIKTWKWEEVCS